MRQDRLGQVLAHLLDSVELGKRLGKLIIQRRKFLLGHLRDGHRDVCLLTAEGATDQSRCKGLRFTLLEATDSLVESFKHPGVLTHSESDPAGGGLRQLLTVLGCGQIDGEDITLLGLTVEFCGGGEPFTEQQDALLHLVVQRRQGIHSGFDRSEVRKIEVGSDVDLRGELDELAILQFGDLDLRLSKRHCFGLCQSSLVRGLDGSVDGLLKDYPPTETLVDDNGRHFTLAEAWDVDLLCDLLVRLVQMGLEVNERDLYG